MLSNGFRNRFVPYTIPSTPTIITTEPTIITNSTAQNCMYPMFPNLNMHPPLPWPNWPLLNNPLKSDHLWAERTRIDMNKKERFAYLNISWFLYFFSIENNKYRVRWPIWLCSIFGSSRTDRVRYNPKPMWFLLRYQWFDCNFKTIFKNRHKLFVWLFLRQTETDTNI